MLRIVQIKQIRTGKITTKRNDLKKNLLYSIIKNSVLFMLKNIFLLHLCLDFCRYFQCFSDYVSCLIVWKIICVWFCTFLNFVKISTKFAIFYRKSRDFCAWFKNIYDRYLHCPLTGCQRFRSSASMSASNWFTELGMLWNRFELTPSCWSFATFTTAFAGALDDARFDLPNSQKNTFPICCY